MLRHWVRHRISGGFAAFVAAVVSPGRAIASASPPDARVAPTRNRKLAESCGLDVSLVRDASVSVSSSHAVDDVPADAFRCAVADTHATLRLRRFGTVSEELVAHQSVTTESLQPRESRRDARDGYDNAIPTIPADVEARRDEGDDPLDHDDDDDSPSDSNQRTNWDAALRQSRKMQPTSTALTVLIADGDPIALDFDQAGNPFAAGPPPDRRQ